MTTYTAMLTSSSGAPLPIAVLDLDAADRLTIVSAEPGQEAFVQDLIERLAAKDGLMADVPPPPETKRFARYQRKVRRGDADYLNALRDFLAAYYDIALEAAGGEPGSAMLSAGDRGDSAAAVDDAAEGGAPTAPRAYVDAAMETVVIGSQAQVQASEAASGLGVVAPVQPRPRPPRARLPANDPAAPVDPGQRERH